MAYTTPMHCLNRCASWPAAERTWKSALPLCLHNASLPILAAMMLLPLAGFSSSAAAPGRVGVVDDRLVSQENWVKPWKADWESNRIVGLFETHGIRAEVIGLETLKSLDRLRTCRAILVPTDECYPDEAKADGPISSNITAYVQAGGIYIMPMGASHCRWRDTVTGAISLAPQWSPRDFLGIQWKIVGEHASPGPALTLTAIGEKIGVPKPAFPSASTYARAAAPTGLVYASNESKQPCLYANAVGRGVVVHYAGGLPLGPEVRDWLIAAYAAVLKSGPDLKAVRQATVAGSPVFSLIPVAAREQGQISLDGEWELAQAPDDPAGAPGAVQGLAWTPVHMPNTVQHALFQAGKLDNPWYSDNYKKLQWIAQKDWYLRKTVTIPADWQDRQVRLTFDGMDYVGVVWLDGTLLGSHEGMFGGPTFDLTGRLVPGRHELLVELLHETAPQSGLSAVMKSMAVDGSSYQWGNRYRTIGLWRPVRLVSTGQAFLEAPCVRTERLEAGRAVLHAQAMIVNRGAAADGAIRAKIVEQQTGNVVWQAETLQAAPGGESWFERTISLENPKLWWPNGVGEGVQPLYRLDLSLAVNGRETDALSSRFGIRTVELARNPSWPKAPRSRGIAWGEPGSLEWGAMQNPDESYRFLFVVNGVPMYAKGACWLTSDDLLVLSPERERWLLGAAKAAGLNLFRLNGGCNLLETEQFYNLCDEDGILVWQELPFCWHTTTGAAPPAWRDQLTQSVLRLRQHPSLAVYCGGNEFNPYGPGVAPVVNLFREICDGYDNRPFRMSSPGGGTAHAYGPWDIYSADPSWYGTLYDEAYNFVSEWSFDTFAAMSLIKRIVPEAELGNKPIGYDWKAFVQDHPILADRSCELNFVGHYPFNKASWYGDLAKAGLTEFLEYAGMAQADVYGCVFEQWRAQFPYKGGQTVWVYNTIGPSSSWNLIDWFGQPMASYYTSKRAHEAVHVMARTRFRSWGPGDTFRASVLTLSDRKSGERGSIKARILDASLKTAFERTWDVTVGATGKDLLPVAEDLAWDIPADLPESYFFLELTLTGQDGKRLSRQVYWERVLKSLADAEARKRWQAAPVPEPVCTNGPWLKPQLAGCPTTLSLEVRPIGVAGPEARVSAVVRNTGANPAYPVTLSVSPGTCAAIWSDSYFWLAPGESATVEGTVRLDMRGLDPISPTTVIGPKDLKITVGAWNVPTLNPLEK